MAVRIIQAGGRTRRKGGAVSLSSGDVPIVTPARDPGLNVPLIPIPVDPTLGLLGVGLQAGAETLDEFAEVSAKIVSRRAAVDIADRSNKFNEDVTEELFNKAVFVSLDICPYDKDCATDCTFGCIKCKGLLSGHVIYYLQPKEVGALVEELLNHKF